MSRDNCPSPSSACGTDVMQQCYESFDPTSASRAATWGDLQTAKTRGQCNKSLLSFSQKSDHWKANKCVSHVFSSQKLNLAKLAPSMRPNSFCSVLAKVFFCTKQGIDQHWLVIYAPSFMRNLFGISEVLDILTKKFRSYTLSVIVYHI